MGGTPHAHNNLNSKSSFDTFLTLTILASENKFSILATMCTPAYYEKLGTEVSRYFDAEGQSSNALKTAGSMLQDWLPSVTK